MDEFTYAIMANHLRIGKFWFQRLQRFSHQKGKRTLQVLCKRLQPRGCCAEAAHSLRLAAAQRERGEKFMHMMAISAWLSQAQFLSIKSLRRKHVH